MADHSNAALKYKPKPEESQIAAVLAAIAKDPTDNKAHFALVEAFLGRKRETGQVIYGMYAEAALEGVAEESKHTVRYRELVAMLYMEQHRFQEVFDTMRRLVAEEASVTGYLLMGDASLELGLYDEALDAYQHAVNLKADLRTYDRVGYLRWLYGDSEGAISMMDEALGLGTGASAESIAWVCVDRAKIFLSRGQDRLAIQSLEVALSKVSDYPPAFRLRARVHLRAKAWDLALADIDAALKRGNLVDDLLLKAEILTSKGEKAHATELVTRAIERKDEDPRAVSLYLGRMGNHPKLALSLAEKELQGRKNIWSYHAYALALYRNGHHEPALEAVDRALSLGTPDASLWLSKAYVLKGLGRTAEAEDCLAKVTAIDSTSNIVLDSGR
ncbi:MAG: tetratricopeptide repeat protein [Myxococcales bacterium]|nr:tetratricopeptide repeat protein [Myxococcales bacterium]